MESDAGSALKFSRRISSAGEFEGARKIGPQFELTIMEDEKRFAGADSHSIREAFREWVADNLPPWVLNPHTEGGIDNIGAVIRNKISVKRGNMGRRSFFTLGGQRPLGGLLFPCG